MTWIQSRDANWRVPYVGGWCLKYVQDAFNTDHPYANATVAWNANYGGKNHTDLPPKGKTCAVYFSLGNVPEGHVAIHLDDGMVASSTQGGTHPQGYLHPNLNDIIAVYGQYNGGCKYLGWSEYCGSVKTLIWEEITSETKVTPILHDTVKQSDPNLEVGKTNVIEGKDGKRTITYTITKHDSVEVKRVVASDVTVPPVSTIINEGSKPVVEPPVPPTPPVETPETTTLYDWVTKIVTIIINFLKSWRR